MQFGIHNNIKLLQTDAQTPDRPAVGTLHLQYILRQVNVSTVSPLKLQAAAADDDTL